MGKVLFIINDGGNIRMGGLGGRDCRVAASNLNGVRACAFAPPCTPPPPSAFFWMRKRRQRGSSPFKTNVCMGGGKGLCKDCVVIEIKKEQGYKRI